MYCNKCAVKVNEDDMFCFNCGNKLKEESVVVSKRVEEVKVSKNHRCFDTFAILALVIGIASLIVVISNILNINLHIDGLEIFEDYEFLLSMNGIVFGILGCKSVIHKGKAITGLVLSSVVTLIRLLELILY